MAFGGPRRRRRDLRLEKLTRVNGDRRADSYDKSALTIDFKETCMSAVLKPGTASNNDSPASGAADVKPDETIDGFHLVIEALKLNGIDTVYGLPGIPITDLTRKLQAE